MKVFVQFDSEIVTLNLKLKLFASHPCNIASVAMAFLHLNSIKSGWQMPFHLPVASHCKNLREHLVCITTLYVDTFKSMVL